SRRQDHVSAPVAWLRFTKSTTFTPRLGRGRSNRPRTGPPEISMQVSLSISMLASTAGPRRTQPTTNGLSLPHLYGRSLGGPWVGPKCLLAPGSASPFSSILPSRHRHSSRVASFYLKFRPLL